ncbi:hypothetical protein DPMN_134949 [Dreissena polymorpha]|uniref:Uncharacterized protein n=1 Tax=Dreissena polymorpha TaxID=45954 RepID=A0A9D4FY91_DREPO|nr:hypothetical protein DPMN_134949 [Dreissena polymorpha]
MGVPELVVVAVVLNRLVLNNNVNTKSKPISITGKKESDVNIQPNAFKLIASKT